MNDPAKGGSAYLQQKIANARDALVDEPPAGGDAPPTALGEEARVCRDLCDALLDVARLRARAAAAKVDITFADTAFDALFRPAGARLTRFQQLTRGTRVRVVHDRQAVLAAFESLEAASPAPAPSSSS